MHINIEKLKIPEEVNLGSERENGEEEEIGEREEREVKVVIESDCIFFREYKVHLIFFFLLLSSFD